MSANEPLLQTIEPDEASAPNQLPSGNISSGNAVPKATAPTNRAAMASTPSDAEAGLAGILRQSSHPLVLFFLYFFRIAACAVYILCGWFTDNYVLSSVIVLVLLAMDFWNCRNVAGRILVGLRYWNQVDDDGESYWVFESRDPTRPANPVDARMFWVAIYTFPVLWLVLLFTAIFSLTTFLPIVVLALVFNVTNAIGFTYASNETHNHMLHSSDRDAKQKWANSMAASGWNFGLGSIGGQLLGSAVKNSVGRVFS